MNLPYRNHETETPADFVPPEAWPEFGAVAQPVSIASRETVGEHPRGIRWGLWPLTFEEYVGDAPPDLTHSSAGGLARNRIVYWKRTTNVPAPAGWHIGKRPWRVDGFYTLTPDDYTLHWGADARRHLKHWKSAEAPTHTIEQISFGEYKSAYKKSGVAKKMGGDLIDVLERKLSLPKSAPHLELWGVRNPSGKIIAGTGILYSPTHLASIREAPFVARDATHTGVATALMDHWFRRSRERGMKTVVSTHFWQPGDPASWKGFSQFKSRFGFVLAAYPPVLWRFMGGKMF